MIGIFSPQYYGSIYYYAALAACERAVIDLGTRYDKRFKSVHRCEISATGGLLRLTVPVSRPAEGGVRQWRQMSVSSHGEWWSDHRVSLESAYGRTPFFEFYIDRFMPWLSDTNESIVDFDSGIDRVLRAALGIATDVRYTDMSATDVSDADISDGGCYADMRRNGFSGFFDITDVPYYQVRADRFGFMPGLSALDLLFNMGPESPLILREMVVGKR